MYIRNTRLHQTWTNSTVLERSSLRQSIASIATAVHYTPWIISTLQGKLDLQLGREAELSKLAECLGRKTKNSPCLIGPAGVGKTAIIEGLAQRIEDGVAPSTLQGKQIFSVNVGDLVSGSSWGNEVPEKIAKFIAPFKTRKDIILVSFSISIFTVIA